jgi:hypothetical protein
MQCYLLRDERLAGVEILPLGLSDEDAIAKAHRRSAKRKGPFTALEVWEGARLVFRERLFALRPRMGDRWPATSPPSLAAE